MTNRKFRILLYSTICFLQTILFVFLSLGFSTTGFCQYDAELAVLSERCKDAQESMWFVNVDYQAKKRTPICENIISMTYSENFSKKSTRLMAISNDDDVACFETLFNDSPLPFSSSVTSGYNYTNNKDLLRFETICINVFQYRERREEHYYDPKIYDGFVYIPDYYADYIIENFYPTYTYGDLIAKGDCNFFTLKYGEKQFLYKIANIFHINGFKDEHLGEKEVLINDYDTGKKLNTFFNGFCFVSNYGHFDDLDPSLHTTVFYEIASKKYDFDDVLKSSCQYKEYFGAEDIKVDIYYINESSQMMKYNKTSSLVNLAVNSNNHSLWQFVLAVFVGIVFYLLSVYLYIVKPKNIDRRNLLFVILANGLIFMLISFITKSIGKTSVMAHVFFNNFTLLVVLINVIVSIVLFLYEIKKGKTV